MKEYRKEHYYKLSLLRKIENGAIREEFILRNDDNKLEIIYHSPKNLCLNSKLERISKKEAEKILNKNKKDNKLNLY